MKRTTVFVDAGLESDLKAIARRRGRAMASVVREALESYVARAKRGAGLRLGFLAIGGSGRRDGAERHEEWLFRDLEPHGVAPRASRRRPSPAVRGAARRSRRRTPAR
jgi:predicted transcriptional regulator